jgi:4-nitrophenyl phosphatase
MNEFVTPALRARDAGAADTTAPTESDLPPRPTWLDQTRGFIIDLDGTLVREGTVMAGAVALLAQTSGRYVIVSNNSTDTAVGMARRLRRLGLPVQPDRLILAGEHAIRFMVARHAAARVMLIASPAIRMYARRAGLTLVEHDANFVVLARDERFTYAKLRVAANELQRGARLIVANPDSSHPSANGGVVPETGSLMAAIVACAGVQPTQTVGKPEDLLFREGLRRLGVAASDVLVIGDNPATDAVGAVRLGMRYLLVGTTPHADASSPAALLELTCSGRTQEPTGPADVDTPFDQNRLSDRTSKVRFSVSTDLS